MPYPQPYTADAERYVIDLLTDAGDGRRLWRRVSDLGGGALERRLGLAAGIVQSTRSPRLIGHISNSFKQRRREIALRE